MRALILFLLIGSAQAENWDQLGNTSAGYATLWGNSTGFSNTAFGLWALRNNTTGALNTAIGAGAMVSNTTGFQNTGVGLWALRFCVSCTSSVAMGEETIYSNIAGTGNVGLGYGALNKNVIGDYNTAIGHLALWRNLGSSNIAIGRLAGAYETDSHTFYVDNQDRGSTENGRTGSLMFGTFAPNPADQTLAINAKLRATFGLALPATNEPPTDSDGHLFMNGGALYFKAPDGSIFKLTPN